MRSIKVERVKHDMTQEELAEKIGASNSQVSSWESGRNIPSIPYLRKMSCLFGVSIDYLIKDD